MQIDSHKVGPDSSGNLDESSPSSLDELIVKTRIESDIMGTLNERLRNNFNTMTQNIDSKIDQIDDKFEAINREFQ